MLRQNLSKKGSLRYSKGQFHYYNKVLSPMFTPISRLLYFIFNKDYLMSLQSNNTGAHVLHSTRDAGCQSTTRCIAICHLRSSTSASNAADREQDKSRRKLKLRSH